MIGICNFCRLLANPLRLKILARVRSASDGINVGVLVDELSQSGIGQSGVSQYLKQLASMGVIRRVRAGRYVNYVCADAPDPAVRQVAEAVVQRMNNGRGRDFAYVFGVMANPFRARVVADVAKAGAISAEEICNRLEHQMKYLKRDLQCAVDAGLLSVDDSDSEFATYRYCAPRDSLVALIVSLVS